MPSTSATDTVDVPCHLFVIHGKSEIVVSDNGKSFTSHEFKAFMKNNGIRHVTTVPYHPASNGLVEKAVQTCKGSLRKATKAAVYTQNIQEDQNGYLEL